MEESPWTSNAVWERMEAEWMGMPAVAPVRHAVGAAHVLAQDRADADAADQVRAEVAVQDAEPVLGRHGERRADGHRCATWPFDVPGDPRRATGRPLYARNSGLWTAMRL